VRLPPQVPDTVAAALLLTGRPIPASVALDVGLIGRIVPDGGALLTAREIADTIAANGPLAIEAILRTLHETQHLSEADAFAHETGYVGTAMASDDAEEGPRAFAEKRAPYFRRQ
jgi:enoyl-CoA hydratase